MRIIVFFLCILFNTNILYAQVKPKFITESGFNFSYTGLSPFWLRSLKNGTVSPNSNQVFIDQKVISEGDSARPLKFQYGLQTRLWVGKNASILIPEAYFGLKYKKFHFVFGRKHEPLGIQDPKVSSGSVTWSGNSLELPALRLSIPEYTKLIFPFLAFKGSYSHGWFGKESMVNNFYLHQKSFYGRIGKPDAGFKLYGGFIHNVQWGGTPKYNVDGNEFAINGKFATGFNTYKNIVFPFNNPVRDSTTTASFDYENRFGNHLGQLEIGADCEGENTRVSLYKQIIFETGQTFSSLTNIDDGLYGISIIKPKNTQGLKRMVVEFLHTTNQGIYRAGLLKLIGFEGKHFGRNQNFYFNHGQYRDGWAYNGSGIGTPFLVPNELIRNEKQSTEIQTFANNNLVKAGYLGFEHQINSALVYSRFSYSRNYGSSKVKIDPSNQLSVGIEGYIPLKTKNTFMRFGIGIDQGDLIRDNYGLILSFGKNW